MFEESGLGHGSFALFWFPFFLDEKMSRGILVELSIVVRG